MGLRGLSDRHVRMPAVAAHRQAAHWLAQKARADTSRRDSSASIYSLDNIVCLLLGPLTRVDIFVRYAMLSCYLSRRSRRPSLANDINYW